MLNKDINYIKKIDKIIKKKQFSLIKLFES